VRLTPIGELVEDELRRETPAEMWVECRLDASDQPVEHRLRIDELESEVLTSASGSVNEFLNPGPGTKLGTVVRVRLTPIGELVEDELRRETPAENLRFSLLLVAPSTSF
jgi:hypothetical protein